MEIWKAGWQETLTLVSLGGILALLTACGSRSLADKAAEDWKKIEALEVPPPKPPDCPIGRSLESITLAGRELADVRIIRAADVLLYVPGEWFDGHYYDVAKRERRLKGSGYSPMDLRLWLGKYIPDIHQVECPGVVHEYTGKRGTTYGGFGFATLGRSTTPPYTRPLRNLSPASPARRIFFIGSRGRTPGDDEAVFSPNDFEEDPEPHPALRHGWRKVRGGWRLFAQRLPDQPDGQATSYCTVQAGGFREGVASRWLLGNVKIGSTFRLEEVEPSNWLPMCRSLRPLCEWLRTPPKDRDPNKTFVIGEAND